MLMVSLGRQLFGTDAKPLSSHNVEVSFEFAGTVGQVPGYGLV